VYIGINVNETKKFVSPKDPDQANPTAFHLGALDAFVKAHIEDSTTEFETNPSNSEEARIKIRYAERNLLTVKFGTRKIENFVDPLTKQPVTIEAVPVKICGMDYLAIPDRTIAILAKGDLIVQLAGEINKLNALGENEAKN
jgi:hypothetical protein